MKRTGTRSGLRKVAAVALLAAPLGHGCSGSETGNPSFGELSLSLLASDESIASTTKTPGVIHVEELWLSVDSIALVACDVASEIAVNTEPLTGNLADGVVAGEVPPGDYCSVRLRLVPGPLPASPPSLPEFPASVAVYGARADDVPFAILSAAPYDVSIPGAAFTIAEGENLLLAFDISAWLRENVLDAATLVDDTAVLDGREHPSLTATFETQLTVSLHRDDNSNGVVDEGEAALAQLH